jgi:hypothetical protein
MGDRGDEPWPSGLPIRAPALESADEQGPLAGMVHALQALGPWLVWSQNPNYRRKPPAPDFLDRYGYAVIAGPAEGPPALIGHAALALGVLLLGPRMLYPEHHHPATELYVPLNVGEWWRGTGPWRTEAPGRHSPRPRGRHATGAKIAAVAIYLVGRSWHPCAAHRRG